MSRSPDGTAEPADPASDEYTAGWVALNKLMRRGYSWSGNERNGAFLNLGDGRFADVAAVAGLDLADDARAAATVDWDFDGDADLFATGRSGPRVRFLRNDQGTSNAFLALRLRGRGANTGAIGARVEVVQDGGGRLVRAVRAGEGYLAQSSAWLSFGLGERSAAASPLELHVRWPDGEVQEVTGLAPNRHYELTQGGAPAPWSPPGELAPLTPSTVAALSAPAPSRRARVVLRWPMPMPRLTLETADGRAVGMYGVRPESSARPGRPLLISLWASWCAPCVDELTSLVERATELRGTGLDVLALSVDVGDARARADEILNGVGWRPYSRGFATADALDVLDALHGAVLDRETRIGVPTSFLVDAEGRIAVIYLGRVDVDLLLRDVELAQGTPDERRDAATPFEGRWYHADEGLDLESLAARLERRGLSATADEFRSARFEVVQSSPVKILHEFALSLARQGRVDEAIVQFQRALEVDPNYFEAHRDLAIAYHRKGQHLEATASYRRALRLRPRDERTHYNLGLALLSMGEREAAELVRDNLARLGSELAVELDEHLARLEDD